MTTKKEERSASSHLYPPTANDRFKSGFGAWLWGSVGFAAVLHFALFALFPSLTAADLRIAVREFEAIELPPEIEVPPPPEEIRRPAIPRVAPQELDEEVTIARTTFKDNPMEKLPPPPSDASRLAEEPVITPFTLRPELRNPQEALELVRRAYPEMLKQAGIGGGVVVWAFIDENGTVRNAKVSKSSGNSRLDEAALRAVRGFEFSPAMNRDRRVPVWIRQKITFAVR